MLCYERIVMKLSSRKLRMVLLALASTCSCRLYSLIGSNAQNDPLPLYSTIYFPMLNQNIKEGIKQDMDPERSDIFQMSFTFVASKATTGANRDGVDEEGYTVYTATDRFAHLNR